MTTSLLDEVRRYADRHTDDLGVARTPVAGLDMFRATRPSPLQYAIYRPHVAVVVQGSKRVTMGRQTFELSAGDSLLIAADVPTVSQITRANMNAPYYSLVLELDPAVIASLAMEMQAARASVGGPVRIEPTEVEVAEAALRLVRVLDRPAALPVLQAQLVREFHFWLLAGRHGDAIRRLGVTDGHAQRIGKAVALIRENYAKPLGLERLADAAGMSLSTFHHHFRAITTLTPLQFQKQLRLIEGRRLMMSEGLSAGNAAYSVGYQSVPHFTREYGRMFGAPPVRDMRQAKHQASTTDPGATAASSEDIEANARRA
ncbi:AraC family transcriptional regulator [Acuticoccus sp. M5D2P5]|uniref:AraC family transcriptional regulator n=1 Tax=Acuticoccus kalidii TaxID=2910977 RepID=UPI001F313683|nr:AraC family transcriptional regulator [Acuticoccus kalidii]MCF3934016.1 AraC family transcriptional regulator [Acuticoccus kalidii]